MIVNIVCKPDSVTQIGHWDSLFCHQIFSLSDFTSFSRDSLYPLPFLMPALWLSFYLMTLSQRNNPQLSLSLSFRECLFISKEMKVTLLLME